MRFIRAVHINKACHPYRIHISLDKRLHLYRQIFLWHFYIQDIVGGGHVSLALSKILATLDFVITVIDERDNPDTLASNHYAQTKLRIPYPEIGNAIAEGEQVFVFIMTHSHKTDEQVAELLADKQVRYSGVLGSRKKIEQLKANLAPQLSVESLQRVRGPIGLPIKSLHQPKLLSVSPLSYYTF